jgi:hypothetical protein
MEPTGVAATILPPRRALGPWTTLAWGVGGGLVMIVHKPSGDRLSHPVRQDVGRPSDFAGSINQDGALIAFTFLISAPLVLGYFLWRCGSPATLAIRSLSAGRAGGISLWVSSLAFVLFGAGFAAEASGREIQNS